MSLDVDRLADEMLRGTQALIAKALGPLTAENETLRRGNEALEQRLAALEAREPITVEVERAPDADRLKALIGEQMPEPRHGKDADPAEVAALVQAEVAKAMAALPVPQDGKDGTDVDPDHVAALIAAEVSKAVAEIPRPQDGRSVSIEDVAPLVAEQVRSAVDAIPKPKDGVGLAGALIDREGALVVTLTNGDVKSLGPVVGRDGVDGKGEPGQDGVGFDDLDVVHDGERGFTFRFVKGERVVEKQFSLPVVLDRGVYAGGKAYEPGDGVTFGGSFWIATEATDEQPGTGKGFRLAVKRGRDGKDGIVKAEAAPSPLKVG